MDSHGLLFNLIVYLSAAVIAVPLFSRLGLGSVLGYLVAGVCIGPWGLGFIQNVQDILHFSEFGVVLLLFLIGLELEPRKLWGMKKPILGAGGSQLLVTTSIIFSVACLAGLEWRTALIIGLALSLSSTAIALQLLNEKHMMSSPVGKTGFSILLFQDIAVIPIIALIPLLGSSDIASDGSHSGVSTPIVIGVMVTILLVGRYALRHIFRFVASTHLREIFTALSLLLVVGIAGIMNYIGVSMALGAFLAGVLLADSEYRHTLESDIEPFKGLLLGLFFTSVGMSVDFGLLFSQPLFILSIAVGLVCIKIIILFLIGWFSKIPRSQRGLFSFLLSQSGEFAFVLFGYATSANALDPLLASQLTLIVAISMATTPLLVILNDHVIEKKLTQSVEIPMDEIEEEDTNVILVGFGRFGQVVGRMLNANGITPTIIDHDPDHIERVRRYGYKTYYGDLSRIDILKSAGADKAKLIILTGGGTESTNQAIALIQSEFPNLKILVRAYDRYHAMHLIDNNVEGVVRESFYSAVELGKKSLKCLGFDSDDIEKLTRTYVEHDIATLQKQINLRNDESAMISIARTAREQLEQTLEADKKGKESATE